MIKKISSIKNLAVFKDFEWDNAVLNTEGRPVHFEKVNVIYGRNYAGKTTLSRILRALEIRGISDKYENPFFSVNFDDGTSINQNQLSLCGKKIRVFNEDFVKDNLRFISNPDHTIKPFAILGDENNAIQNEIAALENEMGINEEGKETGLYAQLKTFTSVYNEVQLAYDQVASTLDKQINEKATGRGNGIKYKLERYGEPNYNKTRLLKDIQSVQSKSYLPLSDEKKLEYEQLLTERIKPTILPISRLSLSLDIFCHESEILLKKEIGESGKIVELLRDATLNEWVKLGSTLHKGTRSNCAFCGGFLSEERWAELFRHFDDESMKIENQIESLIQRIEKEILSVKEGFSVDKNLFYSKFHDQIEHLIQLYSKAAIQYINQLNKIIEQLVKHKESITVTKSFIRPIDYSHELMQVWTSYEEIRIQSNDFSSKLNKEQVKGRRGLLSQEVYEFCEIIGYTDIVRNIDGLYGKLENEKKILEEIRSHIKAKEDKIQELKRQLNDEEKGVVRVNRYLADFFGHEFLSLQAIEDIEGGQKKIRFEVVRGGKRAYHLSEGECSLLAFCYFMAKLDDIDTKGTKPIIWIDDPISSLDGNHIFFVYSLIAAELAEKNLFEQIFVSTHNLDFLKYLRRLNSYEIQANGRRKNSGKQYFIINRQGHTSTIQLMPRYLKEYGTEFNYLFSCIYRCSSITNVDDTNYELFYNFGNNARKFLEIYLFFKYPDYSEDKLQRFFGTDNIPPILIDRLNNEYSHLSGSIERATTPVEVPEMVSIAKLIINKLKEEDTDQFTALLSSIGVTS